MSSDHTHSQNYLSAWRADITCSHVCDNLSYYTSVGVISSPVHLLLTKQTSSHFIDFKSDHPRARTYTRLVIDMISEESGSRVLCWHPVCRRAGTKMCNFLLRIDPEVTGSLGCSLNLLVDRIGSHQSAEGRGLWCPKATPSEWPRVCLWPTAPSACLPLSDKPLSCVATIPV